jgi:hypothetical protein
MDTKVIKRTRKPKAPKEIQIPTYDEAILDMPPSPPKLVREVRPKAKKSPCTPPSESIDIPCDAPAAKVRKNNAWIEHVKSYRLEHPELSYTAAMKEAKDTYNK